MTSLRAATNLSVMALEHPARGMCTYEFVYRHTQGGDLHDLSLARPSLGLAQ